MAIEHVYMYMNSSIIHDEILAHRLGLVPIMANPREFKFIGKEDDVSFVSFVLLSIWGARERGREKGTGKESVDVSVDVSVAHGTLIRSSFFNFDLRCAPPKI